LLLYHRLAFQWKNDSFRLPHISLNRTLAHLHSATKQKTAYASGFYNLGGGAAASAKPHQLGAFLLAKATESIRGKTTNQPPVYQMRMV
jgi:hypothetical protein